MVFEAHPRLVAACGSGGDRGVEGVDRRTALDSEGQVQVLGGETTQRREGNSAPGVPGANSLTRREVGFTAQMALMAVTLNPNPAVE